MGGSLLHFRAIPDSSRAGSVAVAFFDTLSESMISYNKEEIRAHRSETAPGKDETHVVTMADAPAGMLHDGGVRYSCAGAGRRAGL